MICPFLSICNMMVDYPHYTKYCVNIAEDKYLECKRYQELVKEKKTPLDWSKLGVPFGTTKTS